MSLFSWLPQTALSLFTSKTPSLETIDSVSVKSKKRQADEDVSITAPKRVRRRKVKKQKQPVVPFGRTAITREFNSFLGSKQRGRLDLKLEKVQPFVDRVIALATTSKERQTASQFAARRFLSIIQSVVGDDEPSFDRVAVLVILNKGVEELMKGDVEVSAAKRDVENEAEVEMFSVKRELEEDEAMEEIGSGRAVGGGSDNESEDEEDEDDGEELPTITTWGKAYKTAVNAEFAKFVKERVDSQHTKPYPVMKLRTFVNRVVKLALAVEDDKLKACKFAARDLIRLTFDFDWWERINDAVETLVQAGGIPESWVDEATAPTWDGYCGMWNRQINNTNLSDFDGSDDSEADHQEEEEMDYSGYGRGRGEEDEED